MTFHGNMVILVATILVASPALADDHAHGSAAVARTILQEMQADNAAFVAGRDAAFFQGLGKGQHPRATVVMCSDSRVQTGLLDRTPEGDVFVIRNIGNQFATAKGSVQYGVNHLSTSLLLFLGHSSCGAVHAASGDTSTLEPEVRRELATLRIVKGGSNLDGVKANVNHQVAEALQEWGKQVREGHLMIVGAVYDFNDDMKHGKGNLVIINVNGETAAPAIQAALKAATPASTTHGKH